MFTKSDLDVLWNDDPVEFNDNLLLSELSRTNTVTCKALAHKLYIYENGSPMIWQKPTIKQEWTSCGL